MPNFENAFNTICELVKDFRENEHIYLSAKYNESQARKDFIDKFFIALGWDVNHTVQKNPHKQEVKVEETLNNQSRPDYTFYLEPNFNEPKFFVEAKKPNHDLHNPDYYFQAINYARFVNTPVTVLTDFEEFHILDSRYKPNINTVLKNQNHSIYKYTDYADKEKFALIYYLFARDAVLNNSLKDYADKLTASDKKKKKSGYTKSELLSIDEEFLLYLDNIRVRLAKAFKKAAPSLSSEELTEATQRTIDRLVFIRFLEDKNIEPEDIVSKIGISNKAWNDFINTCRKFDAKYNGIVFKEHYIDSQNFGGPELGEFKNICYEFSRKNSQSFNYNLIPIHILGSIYERFLGKVVNASAQRVKVEEKPEVRKAGGVYYTPKYIVDYIVENTVGKIINNCHSGESSKQPCHSGEGRNPESGNAKDKHGKTPAEISKLRFADIACGSGSFLIGVFETLLDYHNNYYWLHQDEAKKDGCLFKGGVPVLSIKQKQNILLNNIYGVDIDSQAVEVTQLSLALKMLEDESLATANEMQVLFHEKILPDLSKNIVCGNSLIGTDIIYEDSSDGLFERKRRITIEEERKLNPMDFEKRFPQVFCHSRGSGNPLDNGFDAIVGNPPYVSLEIDDCSRRYYQKKYPESTVGKINTYRLFINKSILSLKDKGLLGYIIPNTYLTDRDSIKIREMLFHMTSIVEIDFFPEKAKVFCNVTQATTILILERNKSVKNNYDVVVKYPVYNANDLFINHYSSYSIIDFENMPDKMIVINRTNKQIMLIKKLFKNNSKLEELIDVYQGEVNVSTNKDNIHLSKINDTCFPLIRGSNIGRYFIDLSFSDKKGSWINIANNGFRGHYKIERIVTQEISNMQQHRRLNGMPLNINILAGHTANYLLNKDKNYSLLYFVGLLNSYLLDFIFQTFNSTNHIPARELKRLPIPKINFQNPSEKQSHDRIVSLVNEMLEAKKQLQTIKTDRDKTYYENKCTDLDHAIDSEVYKLYNLTEEEIKIVEGNK